MKISYFIIGLFLISCKQVDLNKNQKLDKSAIFAILQGEWLNNEFINKVKETKSPSKSYNEDLTFSALSIDTTNCSIDTLSVGCSINNNHEAFTFKAMFNITDSFRTDINNYNKKDDYFTLILKIDNPDTSLYLNEYSVSNQLIKSIQYKRTKTKTYKYGVGSCIDDFVRSNLFEGSYKQFSANDSDLKRQILFSKNGFVNSLYDKQFYDVQVDFIVSYKNLDMIFFMDSLDNYSNCIRKFYKIKNDTIMIFNTKKAIETGWDTIAELQYKLIKQK